MPKSEDGRKWVAIALHRLSADWSAGTADKALRAWAERAAQDDDVLTVERRDPNPHVVLNVLERLERLEAENKRWVARIKLLEARAELAASALRGAVAGA